MSKKLRKKLEGEARTTSSESAEEELLVVQEVQKPVNPDLNQSVVRVPKAKRVPTTTTKKKKAPKQK